MKHVVLTFLSALSLATGANILTIIAYPSYSHHAAFQPLWRELSLRGHQVTSLTPYPINDPSLVNLTEIDLSSVLHVWGALLRDIVAYNQLDTFRGYTELLYSSVVFTDKQLEHPQVQKLIQNQNASFDLVITEYFVPTMFAFAKRFNCPHIGITSLDPPNFVYWFFGNPIHPAFNTDTLCPYLNMETLTGRVKNVLHYVFVKLVNYFYMMPKFEALTVKHFGENYLPLWDIAINASMLMVNANPVFDKIIPLLPNIVQIGGQLHINHSLQLPNEIKKIMDDSKGVIYFSLGSNARLKDLPLTSQSAILETFAELPYTILWKSDPNDIPNKPKNVFTAKWFPQQALLRHSKVRLFITQGGKQSMEEAIVSNVPMIGIPIFADQFYNVQKMVIQGYGLSLDCTNLQKMEFKSTILEVIQNTKYRERIKKLAGLASDQPMTGLKRAVWWTEYVLRHNGAYHLRSPLMDIPTYQYLLLDVLGVCLLTVVVCLYLPYCLSKYLIRSLRKRELKDKLN